MVFQISAVSAVAVMTPTVNALSRLFHSPFHLLASGLYELACFHQVSLAKMVSRRVKPFRSAADESEQDVSELEATSDPPN